MRWYLGGRGQSRVHTITMATKKALKELLRNCDQKSVKSWVIKWVCESVGYNPIDLLTDLTHHGCISGIVSELIYTHDCLRFYDRFEASILEIVDEFLDSTGETFCEFIAHLRPEIADLTSLKTTLAWFAVEETAYILVAGLEGENS